MWRKSSRMFLPFHYVFCNFVPFWSELFWVWPVLGVAVQDIRWDHNNGSLWNDHPVYFHVFLADSLKPSPEGIETKGFIHGHVKIFQLHHCFVCERSLRITREWWSGMLVWGRDFPKMTAETRLPPTPSAPTVSDLLKNKTQGRNCIVG